MLTVKPDYYDNFKCLMGECPSSCCEQWQVVVDKVSLDYYNGLQGEFAEQLKKETELIDNEYCFKVHNGRCAFLNKDNLCEIHCRLGASHMAATCKKYPDFSVENNTYIIIGQSLSCPYIARKIIKRKSCVTFISQGINDNNSFENEFYSILFRLIHIVQDSSLSVKDRTKLLVEKAKEFQQEFCNKFNIEEFFCPDDNKILLDYCNTLNTLEYLTAEFESTVDELNDYAKDNKENSFDNIDRSACDKQSKNSCTDFDKYIEERQYEYEQVLLYFLYRYFMEGTGDGNFYLSVRFAVFAVRVIYSIGKMIYEKTGEFTVENQIKVCYLFSKEIEHNEKNIDTIFDDISLGML